LHLHDRAPLASISSPTWTDPLFPASRSINSGVSPWLCPISGSARLDLSHARFPFSCVALFFRYSASIHASPVPHVHILPLNTAVVYFREHEGKPSLFPPLLCPVASQAIFPASFLYAPASFHGTSLHRDQGSRFLDIFAALVPAPRRLARGPPTKVYGDAGRQTLDVPSVRWSTSFTPHFSYSPYPDSLSKPL